MELSYHFADYPYRLQNYEKQGAYLCIFTNPHLLFSVFSLQSFSLSKWNIYTQHLTLSFLSSTKDQMTQDSLLLLCETDDSSQISFR